MGAFNPNVTTFQSNCAEGLHFSDFHYILVIFIIIVILLVDRDPLKNRFTIYRKSVRCDALRRDALIVNNMRRP